MLMMLLGRLDAMRLGEEGLRDRSSDLDSLMSTMSMGRMRDGNERVD